MNELKPIDAHALEAVSGGGHKGSSDSLLKDIGYLADSIKDISKKTSGFSSTTMLLLCALALQRNNSHWGGSNVVFVRRW